MMRRVPAQAKSGLERGTPSKFPLKPTDGLNGAPSCGDLAVIADNLRIDVAPHPVFTRLSRVNEGMMRGMEVFGRVLVLGRVAATDVSASEALPQVDPLIAGLDAILANAAGLRDRPNLVEVYAAVRHSVRLLVRFDSAGPDGFPENRKVERVALSSPR
jgi:hypothetical protein